jgi:hypothetical protein
VLASSLCPSHFRESEFDAVVTGFAEYSRNGALQHHSILEAYHHS